MGKKSDGWSLRKLAFWSIVVIALMYLVAQVLYWISADKLANIINWIRWVAEVVALAIVAILAGQYVAARKQVVWTVLYIIIVLIAVVFIVLPRF